MKAQKGEAAEARRETQKEESRERRRDNASSENYPFM